MSDPHDPTIAFADVIATPGDIDLAGWECWTTRDGATRQHYARGPCPACGATSQGRIDTTPKPIESLGVLPDPTREPPPPPDPVEIPVRCACRASHGQPGATSCGRRWSILCPPDA